MMSGWEKRSQGASASRLSHGSSRRPALLVAFLAATSCTGSPGLPPGPTIDAREVALLREADTKPERPLRAVFQWRINEGGARFSGQGVIRMEPPYRARLDLFLNNGEPILQAALVDDELRIPPGAPPGLVPPAPLLWVSLGVFRPGRSSTLVSGATVGSSGISLRYRIAEGGEATFGFTDGRVAGGELLRGGRVEETLSVEWGEEPDVVPKSTLYRNLTAFRELEIEVDSFEFVESYPPDIWSIGS
jgi:hypothetical protein